MEWKDVDWECLRGLRDRFLRPRSGDYWASVKELEHYDLAFAPRIAAKWRAVLQEVNPLLPKDSKTTLLDWGCGTGVVSRLWGQAVGGLEKVWLWDQSRLASEFAKDQLACLGVPCEIGEPSGGESYWMGISHVANELDEKGWARLSALLERAAGFIWVEPGTPDNSRRLVEWRERLKAEVSILAPCPHQARCGLLAAGMERHWCHHFAPADTDFFTRPEWARFSSELGIDLRALPVSYLVGKRGGPSLSNRAGRILGRPRVYKGYAQALVCRSQGVAEEKLRGTARSLKEMKTTVFSRWVE